jgi:hypothetical protein
VACRRSHRQVAILSVRVLAQWLIQAGRRARSRKADDAKANWGARFSRGVLRPLLLQTVGNVIFLVGGDTMFDIDILFKISAGFFLAGMFSLLAMVVFWATRCRLAACVAIVFSVASFGLAVLHHSWADEVAREEGFSSYSDLQAAQHQGITDPKVWEVKRQAMQREEEQKRAEAQRGHLLKHEEWVAKHGGSKTTPAATSDEAVLKQKACRRAVDAVTASLKAPSTATFPSCFWGGIRVIVGANEVWVHGYVDAQNGFGAMLRSPWTVVYDRVAGVPDGLWPRGVSINGEGEIPPSAVRHTALEQPLEALRAKLRKCWKPPAHAQDKKIPILIRFKQDGTLAAPPEPQPSDGLSRAMIDSAVRAITRCQPYTMLSPAKYDSWKEIVVDFTIDDFR